MAALTPLYSSVNPFSGWFCSPGYRVWPREAKPSFKGEIINEASRIMALDCYVVYTTVLFLLQHYTGYIGDEAHGQIDAC